MKTGGEARRSAKKRCVAQGILVFLLALAAGCASASSVTYTNIDNGIRVAGSGLEKKLSSGLPLAFISLRTSELENYLIDELTDLMVQTGHFEIYDRAMLEARAQELNFQLSGDVSDDEQRALGRMAGAQVIISTRITNLNGQVRFSARAIDIETGRILASSPPITVEDARANRLITQVPAALPVSGTPRAGLPAPAQGTTAAGTAGNLPRITIRNNTGERIWYLHISPVTENTWGEDWLGADEVLAPNTAKTVTLRAPLAAQSRYDIRLEDSGGNFYERRDVTLTPGVTLTFTSRDRSGQREGTGPQITVRNGTGAEIQRLYISPVPESSYGSDWLGASEVLPNGTAKTVTLRVPLSAQSRYDIMLLDGAGNRYEKRNVTVSAGMTIIFTGQDRTGSSSSSGASPAVAAPVAGSV